MNYSASWTHRLLSRARGKACEHDCVDCGKQAKHWSQTHDTNPNDFDNYNPRCVSCHWKYDAPIKYPGPGGIGIRSDEVRAKMSISAKLRASRERRADGTYA